MITAWPVRRKLRLVPSSTRVNASSMLSVPDTPGEYIIDTVSAGILKSSVSRAAAARSLSTTSSWPPAMLRLTVSAGRTTPGAGCWAAAGLEASAVDITRALVANRRYAPFLRLRGRTGRGRTNMACFSFVRGERKSGGAWLLERSSGAAASQPREQASRRQRQAGVDEEHAAGRRDAGNGLARQAVELARVCEAQPRARAASRAQTVERFVFDDRTGAAVNRHRVPLLRLSGVAFIHR